MTTYSKQTVLDALVSTTDHLPVVADYQIPAFLEAITDSIPTNLGVGQNFNLGVSVRNAANVLFANGADELEYTVAATNDLTGSFMGTKLALESATEHLISFDTSSPGIKGGTITISTDSQGAANSLVTIPVSYQVGELSAQPLPIVQSFESAPGGQYTLSNPFDDGGNDFFDRFPAPDLSNGTRDDFTGFDGSFAVSAKTMTAMVARQRARLIFPPSTLTAKPISYSAVCLVHLRMLAPVTRASMATWTASRSSYA